MELKKVNELQDKLIKELQNLISHLDRYEEKNWSMNFSKIKKLIEHGDKRGIKFLKNMFAGGMGSFNDLIICKMNGHKIKKNEEDFANIELKRLSNIVFITNDKLNHELNKN